MEEKNNTINGELVHTFPSTPKETVETGFTTKVTFIFLVCAVLLGGISGFAYKKLLPKTIQKYSVESGVSNVKPKQIAGIQGKKNFKDKAEGTLRKGGVEGEGSFHLERPGGESQNVYLTSSTVDLAPYVNKKVRVQGETYASEKAGWLMDVGFVEILN